MSTPTTRPGTPGRQPSTPESATGRIETNGINVIAEEERKGNPADLFWPWCASNVSVLAVSYGAFVLAMGVGLWQGIAAAILGAVLSFLLVGLISIAGMRGSAPTLVLSRAAFGKAGNALPGVVSYLLLVGWETVLVALSTMATATVFSRLGWGDGNAIKIVGFLVVAGLIVFAGILGFDAIMRAQKVLTWALVIVTIVYIALTVKDIHYGAATAVRTGGLTAVVGAAILVMTGFGMGWVNSAADYSRYLPRRAGTGGVVGWPTLGGSLPVVVLVVYGLFLCASDKELATAINSDPIGALTSILPTWFLVPFALVAVLGLVSGAMLDIYSSGLTLLTLGLRTPRWVAAGLDGVLMILGAIYIVWFATSFLTTFQAFLITLGVPMSAWCGIFLADLLLRRRDYDEEGLYSTSGRYGAVQWQAVLGMALATAAGWGLIIDVMDSGSWLSWLGFLLGPLGLGGREGAWAHSNLGVPAALLIGFAFYLLTAAGSVRRQERGKA